MATADEIIDQLSGGGGIVYCGKCLDARTAEGCDYGYGACGYGTGPGVHSDVCLESTCCGSEELLLKSELPEEEEFKE